MRLRYLGVRKSRAMVLGFLGMSDLNIDMVDGLGFHGIKPCLKDVEPRMEQIEQCVDYFHHVHILSATVRTTMAAMLI
jgi:hypothetical protein